MSAQTARRARYIAAVQNLRRSNAATPHGYFRPGRGALRASAVTANLAEWGYDA